MDNNNPVSPPPPNPSWPPVPSTPDTSGQNASPSVSMPDPNQPTNPYPSSGEPAPFGGGVMPPTNESSFGATQQSNPQQAPAVPIWNSVSTPAPASPPSTDASTNPFLSTPPSGGSSVSDIPTSPMNPPSAPASPDQPPPSPFGQFSSQILNQPASGNPSADTGSLSSNPPPLDMTTPQTPSNPIEPNLTFPPAPGSQAAPPQPPAQDQTGLPETPAEQTPGTGTAAPAQPQTPAPPDPSSMVTPDQAPTDLSHLINQEEQAPSDVYNPPVSNQATPSNQPAPNTQIPQQAPAAPEKNFNLGKLLIVIGAIALVLAIGGSAYFILGIGRTTTPAPASVPAEQQQAPLTNPPKQVNNSSSDSTTTPDLTANAPGSPAPVVADSSFGAINASGSASKASPSPTSALDKLKAARQTATASSTTK